MGEQRKIFPFRWSEDDPFLRCLSTVIKLVVRLRLSRGVEDFQNVRRRKIMCVDCWSLSLR